MATWLVYKIWSGGICEILFSLVRESTLQVFELFGHFMNQPRMCNFSHLSTEETFWVPKKPPPTRFLVYLEECLPSMRAHWAFWKMKCPLHLWACPKSFIYLFIYIYFHLFIYFTSPWYLVGTQWIPIEFHEK